MNPAAAYEFGPFRVDVRRRLLLRGEETVPLNARTFDTLIALIERRGQMVEKDALMTAVWADTAVEESNLTQQISLLRKALGEQPPEHTYIATTPRRGYTFVAPVRVLAHETAAGGRPARLADHIVGRERESAALHAIFRDVLAGRGGMVCLAGEPGIGKTTVAELFLREIALQHDRVWVARGRCSERLAGSDAYLPVIEALEDVIASSTLPDVVTRMRALAPAWAQQLHPGTRQEADGAPSQERLKREFTNLVLALASNAPGVLFLDDLQWVDESTADVLAYVAARAAHARLLILCTYRPAELVGRAHPFVAIKLDLEARGICRDLPLGFLSQADVGAYLRSELTPHSVPAELTARLHVRTEGNPLFLKDLVRDMRHRGLLAVEAGAWTLTRSLSEVAADWPQSVRSMVERAIGRVGGDDRTVITVASVQGVEFDSVTVARAAHLEIVDVEEALDRVERQHGLVRRLNEVRLPSGVATTRYAFVHVLYQNALHMIQSRSRRAAVSGSVGDAVRALHGDQSGRVAHQLAVLYAAADRAADATAQFHAAAHQALAVGAAKEAVALTRQGLALLPLLPGGADRDRQELGLLITLGVPLAATTGYANPEVEATYTRARQLATGAGDGAAQFASLWGLWALYHVRADLSRARDIAGQLLEAGARSGDLRILQVAHTVSGYTIGHMGEIELALDHLDRAAACCRPEHHAFFAAINALDPAVAAPAQEGRLLCLLGDRDNGLVKVNGAIALARTLNNPNAIGFALVFAAYVHQMRGEPQQVLERTDEAIRLADEHGLADVRGWGTVWRGWALARLGHAAEAIAPMQQALAAQRSFGSEIARPHQLALLAEALMLADRREQALAVIDEGLAQASRTGDRYYEPELRRLRQQVDSTVRPI